jgi:RNase P subunit RPR2
VADVIRMMCPSLKCRTILAVPPEARGRMVRCRACGTSIRVPQQPKAKPATTADDSEALVDGPPAATGEGQTG